MPRLLCCLLLVFACTACAGAGRSGRSGAATVARASVVRVVDGDTVDLRFGSRRERVRLLGIDTPETVKSNTSVQCFGPEASARTKSLLPAGTRVSVERDREPRDRFGRLLLYVYRGRDGLFVNLDLVTGGYARALRIVPNTAHAPELSAAAATAQRGGLGLWSSCINTHPQRPSGRAPVTSGP